MLAKHREILVGIKNYKDQDIILYQQEDVPVLQSQSLTELSAAPDRNLVESQLTSIHQTAPLCPLNVPSLSPLTENHTLGV